MDNKQTNANQYAEMYKSLDIDLGELGCVMLDVELGEAIAGADEFLGDNLYTSDNEKHWWIKGLVAQETPHMTLLYGLMKSAEEYADPIATVMNGWSIQNVKIQGVSHFESVYDDEPYYCIVANVKLSTEIEDGRARLQMLPHINTFKEYRPHITLAYIKKDPAVLESAVKWFNERLHSARFPVTEGLNLGGEK